MTQERPALFKDLDPSARLLMGPGPVDVYPRVLRAMSVPMLGQFDPEFTGYMNETMADRKSTRLNSSHVVISYAVFCLKKKKKQHKQQ